MFVATRTMEPPVDLEIFDIQTTYKRRRPQTTFPSPANTDPRFTFTHFQLSKSRNACNVPRYYCITTVNKRVTVKILLGYRSSRCWTHFNGTNAVLSTSPLLTRGLSHVRRGFCMLGAVLDVWPIFSELSEHGECVDACFVAIGEMKIQCISADDGYMRE
jgi:hypothetical protein